MTPQEVSNIEHAIASTAERSFEILAQDLDQLSMKHGLDSVAMMAIVHRWANFPHYYADWIQESWKGWTPVGGDV